jgi:anthranilate phosphoribosyltransferase
MTDDSTDFRALIARVADGNSLSVPEAHRAFDIMMSGNATPSQMGAFLMALRVRGETVDEIIGGVTTMREKMLAIDAPEGAIDVVGTGGDAIGTYNISTATALAVAGAGVPVAKHGNRALSSKTGAADVLAALGVNLDADMGLVREAVWEAGICFMLAPRHHGSMRNVAGTRVELGTRTIFNLLGPMSNPANVKRLLIGVFAKRWLRPMAETMRSLGAERLWVVHGGDGTDELTPTGPSRVCALEDGEIREFEISPQAAGLPTHPLASIRGADPAHNADALRRLLDGAPGAFRDAVLYNAAAAFTIAGKAADLKEGVALAAAAIDGGRARAALAKLVEITNREPAAP